MATELAFDPTRLRHHALVFDDPERTLLAVKTLRAEGFEVADVHSPFPVHGIDAAMGMKETRLPWATFVGGCLGLCLAAFIQVWTHASDWPLNIGGKSNLALPALVPVGFELTVLLAAFATVGALFVSGRLFPASKGELPARQPILEVSNDRFVVLVAERDASFSSAAFDSVCKRLQPEDVLRDRRAR